MDQLQAIRVFVRVVETGNLSRAAESLGMTRASVTKQIQALEASLKTRLLNRTTRRVTVTPDGSAYHERGARLLADFDELQASMVNASQAPHGRICVDMSPALARLVVVPALPAFLRQYPEINIDVGVSDWPVDLLAGNVDVVLRVGEVTDQSLIARRIGQLSIITVAAPGYLERFGTPAHPRDLDSDGHTLVGFFQHGGNRLHYPNVFQANDETIEIHRRPRVGVNELNTHLVALLAGHGLGQTFSFVAEPHLANGQLVQILAEWTRPSLPIYLVYQPNRHLSARVRAFVDWVARLFDADPRLRIVDPVPAPCRQRLPPSAPPLADAYPGRR